ncbi:MAG: NTP transferase domain-containing protein [Elusimicrobia bacterium]|nr:NTP transferase domain-containing protein [Elusimicrobiota bacterium]
MRHAGIIAAGDGTRLAASHPGVPKPLVPVSGAPLCHWVARSLIAAGAAEVTVVHNSRGRAVRASLERAFPGVRWDFRQNDTANSWETFRLVCQAVGEKAEGFLVSTVDSLIPPDQAAAFAASAASSDAAAALALTSFVDDEKPLWAEIDARGLVTALGPKAKQKKLVTSGLYYMTGRIAKLLPPAAAHDSLRSYWGTLVGSGARVAGITLSKTLDVDRPEDIREAEGFLKAASVQW